MPKERAGDGGWVDNWDAEDAEIAAPPSAAPAPGPAQETSPTGPDGPPPSALRTPQGEPGGLPQSALSWREVFHRTPAWIWLISMLAAGGICMMFMTVMLIIGFGK